MDKEYFQILIFSHHASGPHHLRVHGKTFKILLYLFAFVLLSTIFFFCDYIQVKKMAFELNQLNQERQEDKSKIHRFLTKIGELERELIDLRDFDSKIRIVANIERRQQTVPLVGGMGGPSSSDIRETLKRREDEKGLVQQMKIDIEHLLEEAISREESFVEIEKYLQIKQETLTRTPSIWPVRGWVTSGFSFRSDPFTEATQMHEGLDISNQVGTMVITPADGLVSDIGKDAAFGRILVISHGLGITTRYAHLNKFFVKVGQKVKRGDRIGEIGMSGKTTGPHLHYELRVNGIPIDPMRYILN